jgi:hypothetical protein
MFEALLMNIFEMHHGEDMRLFPGHFQANAVKHETCRVIGNGWKIDTDLNGSVKGWARHKGGGYS